MTQPKTVFALFEVWSDNNYSSLIDLYEDWDKAEQARVGLNLYSDSRFFTYEVVEYELK